MTTAEGQVRNARTRDNVSKWYSSATVRHAERVIVPDGDKDQNIYPKGRQLLSEHPLVVRRGSDAVTFVLNQSAYRYMYEIGLLETRLVIDCSLNIVNNLIPGATDEQKLDALAIVIDEGYHAHVALDFITQMKKVTGVAPVEVPETNRNLDAIHRAMASLPSEFRMDFQLIAVCLAEHTLTKDLLSIGKEKESTQVFTQVMTDHVSDEGRHALYFAQMMQAHWLRMSEASKSTIAAMLPEYIADYLAGDIERRHDRKVLAAIGLAEEDIAVAIAETQEAYVKGVNDYVRTTAGRLVNLLRRAGMLDHPVAQAAFAGHWTTTGAAN